MSRVGGAGGAGREMRTDFRRPAVGEVESASSACPDGGDGVGDDEEEAVGIDGLESPGSAGLEPVGIGVPAATL